MMKPLFRSTAALMLMFALALLHAQNSAKPNRAIALLNYDARQEQPVAGTVAVLLVYPPAGMLPGSHLLLTTTNGPVDVSLGAFALRGKNALSLSAAQQIEVTGVTRTFRGKPVLLARTITIVDHIYVIRNEHGIPITPKARERAAENLTNQETR